MNTPDHKFVLPRDDASRRALHNEVHARPPARIELPALITHIAVLNAAVSVAQEHEHLAKLPLTASLQTEDLAGQFLSLHFQKCTLKWERHSEFTGYTLVQGLGADFALAAAQPDLSTALALPGDWLRSIPGQTICAIQLVMLEEDSGDIQVWLAQAQRWFGGHPTVASSMGNPVPTRSGALGHSLAITRFHLEDDGFERMLVLAHPGTSQNRAGRIAQRLLELETYRLMALRGFPIARGLGASLAQAEAALASITQQLEIKSTSDQSLLDQLVALATGVERIMAEHDYRFSATAAYHALVEQRILELREKAISGTPTIGEFMHRRLSPAMATVAATRKRLNSLSERVARTSELLGTRVNIATEEQNRQLLEKLTKGQAMQLRLQTTVEGLSLAAISYYVVSLVLYTGKALKSAGLAIDPEVLAGASIPVVLLMVWKIIAKVHAKLRQNENPGESKK